MPAHAALLSVASLARTCPRCCAQEGLHDTLREELRRRGFLTALEELAQDGPSAFKVATSPTATGAMAGQVAAAGSGVIGKGSPWAFATVTAQTWALNQSSNRTWIQSLSRSTLPRFL